MVTLTSLSQFLKQRKKEEHASSDSSYVDDEARALKEKIHRKRKERRRIGIIISTLFVLVVLLIVVVLYSQYRLHTLTRDEIQAGNVVMSQPKTGEEIIQAVARLVTLPDGVPQIAEIKDVNLLKQSQAFFENAENGDLILVYGSSIYLYRPSTDKLINFGNIEGR
jgi:cell division protein FtsL